MNPLLRSGARFVLPPLILLIFVLAAWHAATVVFDIKRYLLPGPAAVAQAAWRKAPLLASASLLTGKAALAGFLASFAVGLLLAGACSQSRVIQRSLYPYAIFLQTVPIVGIAPLIVVWFGYGFTSVVVVAFIISLFPIITNATAGLTAIDRNLLELFELGGASRWQTLLKLRLPASVPYLATGARISAGLSVVGAIVGEIFAGSGMDAMGLGYLIDQSRGNLRTDELFAAVIASALLGIVIFGAVNLLSALVLRRWH